MDYQQRNQQRGGQRAGNNGSAGPNRAPMVQPTNSGPPPMNNIQTELLFMRQEAAQVRSAIYALEEEKDSLRKAIRKLKVSLKNIRFILSPHLVGEYSGPTKSEASSRDCESITRC
jgi:hypothetical protein